MLQQTQVATVIPYFEKFMTRFPDVAALAAAPLDEVLHHWTGLGYYARARNLHRAARQLVAESGGRFPESPEALETLPGIGRSTAGAIAAIAWGVRAPILDGNVKRVLARCHAIDGYPGEAATAKRLWAEAEAHTPQTRVGDYTQAIMDLGATVCTRRRPACDRCPFEARCRARKSDRIADYPGRRQTKTRPVRRARMFLFHDSAGGCLLERRPPQGIWGGLWTPPERAVEVSGADTAALLGYAPYEIHGERAAPTFRHTFTHFHLDIEPVYVEVPGPPAACRDADHLRWYARGSNEAIGLSAPAVKLLATLKSAAST
ncbi:MAG: A/G-specific adenine glycosylase, partial [Pseudomonadales bacterium]|nr:A/G-specific adenine glycosylase [Pseudomonadales bacterium]